MYYSNLKRLRNEKEITQRFIAEILGTNRNTYKNWENGLIMIPLEFADKLSLYYNVSLSYLLGISTLYNKNGKIRKMNYKVLIQNLNSLKEKNKNSYYDISINIGCAKSTCHSYFNEKIKIPIDILIKLSEFYKINIDKLCGK